MHFGVNALWCDDIYGVISLSIIDINVSGNIYPTELNIIDKLYNPSNTLYTSYLAKCMYKK